MARGISDAVERGQLIFDGVMYWRELPNDEKDGPFCRRCYDSHVKLVRLQQSPEGLATEWHCTICRQGY